MGPVQSLLNGLSGCILTLGLALLLLLEPLLVPGIWAQGRRSRRPASSGEAQALTEEQRIRHALTRLSFGLRPGDIERVKAMGLAAYIDQQLDPDTIDDSALDARLARLRTLALDTPTLIAQYNPPPPAATPQPPAPKPGAPALSAPVVDQPKPAAGDGQKPASAPPARPQGPPQPMRNPQQVITELQRAAFLRAAYSERQLYETMVAFWENHFSIFINKDADRFLMTSFDRDVIRPFALGRFRDLLGATARSPAMLFYLDNWQSSVARQVPAAPGKPARTVGGINENYARELMELHTLGVDGGYTQKDVQEVARCFTGWTIRKPNEEGLFYFNPAAHDQGPKTVLGRRIPAGGGLSDGERVLDILAAHPSTARFIATKLARRFISDDPPRTVIDRAAAVFLKTDGSIRETLRAILTAPEFFSRAAYRAKTRSPFEYAVAAVRALGVETDGDRPILDWVSRMGQPLFGRITPDGYADRADQWLSTGLLLERLNFASALAMNKIKGTRFDAARLLADIDLNDPQQVQARLIEVALGGDATPQTREALGKAINEMRSKPGPAPTTPVAYTHNDAAKAAPPHPASPLVEQLVALVVGSPEFQRR